MSAERESPGGASVTLGLGPIASRVCGFGELDLIAGLIVEFLDASSDDSVLLELIEARLVDAVDVFGRVQRQVVPPRGMSALVPFGLPPGAV